MRTNEQVSRISIATLIELSFTALVALAWGAYTRWGYSLVERLYRQQGPSFLTVPGQIRVKATVQECYEWGNMTLGGIAVAAMLLTAAHLAMPWEARRLARAAPRLALSWGFPLVAAATILAVFNRIAIEGPWYPIDDAMLLKVDPPFRHRILFVAVAWACEYAVPSLSHQQSFLASQFLAVVMAVLAVQAWCRRVAAPDWSYFGIALMGMMLTPTFQYYTFYDFGIVLFYALSFTLLSSRSYIAYIAALGIGTLNHEVMLFMIPVAAGIARSHGISRARTTGFVIAQFAVYASVRSALFWLMPVERAWLPGKVWVNIDFLVHVHYLTGTMILMTWFAVAILSGAKHAPAELRWAILLLPMLIGMTVLVGQINEARQFVAFVPTAVALILVKFDRVTATGSIWID